MCESGSPSTRYLCLETKNIKSSVGLYCMIAGENLWLQHRSSTCCNLNEKLRTTYFWSISEVSLTSAFRRLGANLGPFVRLKVVQLSCAINFLLFKAFRSASGSSCKRHNLITGSSYYLYSRMPSPMRYWSSTELAKHSSNNWSLQLQTRHLDIVAVYIELYIWITQMQYSMMSADTWLRLFW